MVVIAIPFFNRGKGWHAPTGRPDLRTPTSSPGRADQTGPKAGAGNNPGTRPTDRVARQPKRRQPVRRSGRDPGLLTITDRRLLDGDDGQKLSLHPPCRFGTPAETTKRSYKASFCAAAAA